MPQRSLYLAAYDIQDSVRLREALALVRPHASNGQKSVHALHLTPGEKDDLLHAFSTLLDEGDRFLLLRLDPRATILTRGRGQVPATPSHVYLG